jgi:hypothetical protein
MVVGGLQGRDMAMTDAVRDWQIGSSSGKPLSVEPHHKMIGHEPGVAGIDREGCGDARTGVRAWSRRNCIEACGCALSYGPTQS